MTEEQARHYVSTTAAAIGLPLDAARISQVAAQLQRTFAVAVPLMQYPLAPEDEPAEIFRPAPFPNTLPNEDPAWP
jgi:hypothetical protein